MIRYLCDRCGKEIKEYSGMKVKWEMGASQLPERSLFCGDEGEYDLCDECSSEFKGWIENAKDNNTGEAAESE